MVTCYIDTVSVIQHIIPRVRLFNLRDAIIMGAQKLQSSTDYLTIWKVEKMQFLCVSLMRTFHMKLGFL